MNKTLFYILKIAIPLVALLILSNFLPTWLAIVITLGLFLLFMPVDPPGHENDN